MRNLIILLFTLLFTFLALAEKRPFTIDDLYKIKSVRDPHFSPDGKKIAFTATEYFLKEGKSAWEVYGCSCRQGPDCKISQRQLSCCMMM